MAPSGLVGLIADSAFLGRGRRVRSFVRSFVCAAAAVDLPVGFAAAANTAIPVAVSRPEGKRERKKGLFTLSNLLHVLLEL